LEFLSEHRFATRPQLVALLGFSDGAAYQRLKALAKAGLVRFEKPLGRPPPCYQVTRSGLAAIGSTLAPPKPLDLANYAHDLGVAWLCVAARAGFWGGTRELVTERRMRSYDASAERREQIGGPGEPFAARLLGFGAAGREQLHYPDLILVDRDRHRIAFEPELSPKGRARRQRILEAYAGDGRFDAVVYMVERADVARLVERSAARLGISNMVHVQRFRDRPAASAAKPAATAARIRPERRSEPEHSL
jgi:DNA-binding PadR family transcriptional regulator